MNDNPPLHHQTLLPPGNSEHQYYRVREFQKFGETFDINYRFPNLSSSGDDFNQTVIAEGQISEHILSSGFRFTFSDLRIRQHYESVSLGHAPLLILVVQEGNIRLKIGALERELTPGSAVTMQLHPEYALQAIQPAQERLTTMTLAFNPKSANVGRAASPALYELLARARAPFFVWTLPYSLKQQLQANNHPDLPEAQQNLVLEGLALQLAGLGVTVDADAKPVFSSVSEQQQKRLELVRQHLEFSPDKEHQLRDLARLAAMSESGLRTKFRNTYGVSVFEYWRRCRFELARQYLEQGFSVQQTAHMVGYRHATNFTTAYRRHFGLPPKNRPETNQI
ncbi:AraC-type DNA-binding protein [Marinobacter persicus]|uniref:AraC-type DNA-binding protein n=1 Tax=Marinobacter persicus TaxID=930118 RepID=A0A1I3UBT0_9GAMM|nr:helix-turn-helix transcriptional regulator [Marinobacter persicus]GHD54249.1 AraC family transcriptional regulator [Marinobacter persicus]SFJ79247.1 AraC-type DNA-binding protein [Marinobacter persicus]